VSAASLVLAGGLVLLGLGALLALLRLALGRSLADRVLALDFLSLAAVGASALYAMLSGRTVFLDVGLVIAVAAFVATVAFGAHIARSGRREER
jgi:multicomponent Na+:H+ antiporter subunit F